MRRIAEERDAQAFEILYEREGPFLHAFATVLARQVPRARDVAAEAVNRTFLRMWERAATFDPARASVPADRALRAWLRAILKHEIFTVVRKEQVTVRREPALDDMRQEVDAADRAEAEWRQLRLSKTEDWLDSLRLALTRIAPDSRALLAAVYFEGVSHEEAAHRLGISVNALRQRVHRAVAELREAVESEERR